MLTDCSTSGSVVVSLTNVASRGSSSGSPPVTGMPPNAPAWSGAHESLPPPTDAVARPEPARLQLERRSGEDEAVDGVGSRGGVREREQSAHALAAEHDRVLGVLLVHLRDHDGDVVEDLRAAHEVAPLAARAAVAPDVREVDGVHGAGQTLGHVVVHAAVAADAVHEDEHPAGLARQVDPGVGESDAVGAQPRAERGLRRVRVSVAAWSARRDEGVVGLGRRHGSAKKHRVVPCRRDARAARVSRAYHARGGPRPAGPRHDYPELER